MWVRPEYMGTGLGRRLLEQVTAEATARGLQALELSADPNAEGFYRHMGAVQIGEVPADIDGRARVLPRMRIQLSTH
jgi:GNAT superfamily N-acetyltransferase